VFVDTQAYIARSEDGSSITLAVRGSESSKDWATNLTAVQTRWEPNTGGDLKRGHAGMFSCFDACAINQGITPMVHLGWYVVPIPNERASAAPRPTRAQCDRAAGGGMCDLAGRRGGSGDFPPTALSLARFTNRRPLSHFVCTRAGTTRSCLWEPSWTSSASSRRTPR
jgi:hypothetical protein